ncbi:50S ribosomal protein L9 [Chloroflexota bacterium]
MKVIFLEDVPNVARAGEEKEVKDGFGRNFLIPRKFAVVATPAEMKKLEAQRKAYARREAQWEQEAKSLAEVLQEMTVVFKRKVGAKERLYGSVTTADIAEEIKRLGGHEIDKRKIELENPIHELGTHQASIKLAKDVTAVIQVIVEAEAEAEEKSEAND